MPLHYERFQTKVGFGTLSPDITTNPDDQGGETECGGTNPNE